MLLLCLCEHLRGDNRWRCLSYVLLLLGCSLPLRTVVDVLLQGDWVPVHFLQQRVGGRCLLEEEGGEEEGIKNKG